MKKYIVLSFVYVSLFVLSGCATVDNQINKIDQETYNELLEYQESIGKTCLKYVDNDPNLSTRDKNVFHTKYSNFDGLIKTNFEIKK